MRRLIATAMFGLSVVGFLMVQTTPSWASCTDGAYRCMGGRGHICVCRAGSCGWHPSGGLCLRDDGQSDKTAISFAPQSARGKAHQRFN
jgi:hypothetical protein